MTLRWEWTLPSGDGVAATLDPDAGTESVFLGEELVSRSARGQKEGGHTVARGDESLAVVTFDPAAPICVLREPDGMEIAPRTWPSTTKRAAVVAPQAKPTRRSVVPLAALGLVALGGAVWLGARMLGSGSTRAGATTGHRAPNGLFIAHYPAPFALRQAVVPAGASGVTLEDAESGDAVVIVAAPESSRELWAVQQRLGAEALANAPRADGSWDEAERRDEACRGEPGAVVRGRVKNRRGEPARIWSCTFLHEGAAYVTLLETRATTTVRDEARLRQILEATDLTHLEDMSAQPAR